MLIEILAAVATAAVLLIICKYLTNLLLDWYDKL